MIWAAFGLLVIFASFATGAYFYRKHQRKPPARVDGFGVFVSPDGKQRIHVSRSSKSTMQHWREKGWREQQ